jgi:hypothetical protein
MSFYPYKSSLIDQWLAHVYNKTAEVRTILD